MPIASLMNNAAEIRHGFPTTAAVYTWAEEVLEKRMAGRTRKE